MNICRVSYCLVIGENIKPEPPRDLWKPRPLRLVRKILLLILMSGPIKIFQSLVYMVKIMLRRIVGMCFCQNMKNYSTISRCRLCRSRQLSKLFSLGNLYISTFVKKPGQNIGRAPLELVWCNKCTLVQLKHTAKQELLYSGNYWYESGLNKIIRSEER